MSEGIKSMEKAPSTVRRATPEDAEAMVDVHYRSWLATYPPIVEGLTEDMIKKRFRFDPMTGLKDHVEIARERIENPMPNTRQFVHVSEETRQIDGFVVAGENKNSTREIRAMYVDPKAQGRGVGSQLMKAALEYMHAEVNPVVLDVALKNDNAIRFYERHGFVKLREIPDEEVSFHLGKSDFYIPEMEMIREPAPL